MNDMEKKRQNTIEAHQKYASPLVGVIIFLFHNGKIAVVNQGDTWSLPETYARGHEWLEQAIYRAVADSVNGYTTVESCTLLSGGYYREDVYQFNYVAFARMNGEKKRSIKWVSPSTVEDMNIYYCHRQLLEKYFSKGYLKDEVVVPEDPSNRGTPAEERLKRTRKVHAECKDFPMPQLTVDGLLLKFSENYEFEGIILERRSKNVDREPGKWAFPAGFVNANERMSEALAYEVYEEIGVTLERNHFLSGYRFGTGPYRDPKYFVWTQFLVAYTMEENFEADLSEIEEVKVFPLDGLPFDEMAFDHGRVLREFVSLPHCIRCVEKYQKVNLDKDCNSND